MSTTVKCWHRKEAERSSSQVGLSVRLSPTISLSLLAQLAGGFWTDDASPCLRNPMNPPEPHGLQGWQASGAQWVCGQRSALPGEHEPVPDFPPGSGEGSGATVRLENPRKGLVHRAPWSSERKGNAGLCEACWGRYLLVTVTPETPGKAGSPNLPCLRLLMPEGTPPWHRLTC